MLAGDLTGREPKASRGHVTVLQREKSEDLEEVTHLPAVKTASTHLWQDQKRPCSGCHSCQRFPAQ